MKLILQIALGIVLSVILLASLALGGMHWAETSHQSKKMQTILSACEGVDSALCNDYRNAAQEK